jgi:hypothetical protein
MCLHWHCARSLCPGSVQTGSGIGTHGSDGCTHSRIGGCDQGSQGIIICGIWTPAAGPLGIVIVGGTPYTLVTKLTICEYMVLRVRQVPALNCAEMVEVTVGKYHCKGIPIVEPKKSVVRYVPLGPDPLAK